MRVCDRHFSVIGEYVQAFVAVSSSTGETFELCHDCYDALRNFLSALDKENVSEDNNSPQKPMRGRPRKN